jgi:hypothetical protein
MHLVLLYGWRTAPTTIIFILFILNLIAVEVVFLLFLEDIVKPYRRRNVSRRKPRIE